MSVHYQGAPSRQIIDQTVTGYSLDVKPADYSDLTTEPKVTNDIRKVVAGNAMPVAPENLVAIRSDDVIGYSIPLISGSSYSEYMNDINYTESSRTSRTTSAIRAGKFNFSTGKFAPAYPVVAVDSFGNDNAARSSYDVPGSISFRVGNTITTQNYSSKG